MSGPLESRVRAVMRELRCDWRGACAWLGRKGAAARAARQRRSAARLVRAEAVRRHSAEF